MLCEGARNVSSNTLVLCVCIHSAIRCLSARLPYFPHMLSLSNSDRVYRTALSRIILASATLSATTEVKRGDGLLMSSRARRTAATIDAEMTSVEAKRSCF
jgi:hypothetical protein